MRQALTQQQAEEEQEINITPMLDVVFIMLIFFIVTATFVKESGIDVNRPQAATSVVKEKANILVAIDAHNKVWINRRHGLEGLGATAPPEGEYTIEREFESMAALVESHREEIGQA